MMNAIFLILVAIAGYALWRDLANFALVMFIALVVTGLAYLYDYVVARKKRAPDEKEPSWIEYSKSFFPVILIVFVLRSFLVEPFKIPSSSMRPTLEVGDFILVNKYVYGIRLPIIEKKVFPLGTPQRGDVMVFRYPQDPSKDYIKRVVGIPGDEVVYRDKQLTINGQPVALTPAGSAGYIDDNRFRHVYIDVFEEKLGEAGYKVAHDPKIPPFFPDQVINNFPAKQNCVYNVRGLTCKVPSDHYFMMGDNRDNSQDSRFWGFVPDDHIRGRAFFIWFNWDDITSFAFKRVGTRIR